MIKKTSLITASVILLSLLIYACNSQGTVSPVSSNSSYSGVSAEKPDTSARPLDSLQKASVLSDTGWKEAAVRLSGEKSTHPSSASKSGVLIRPTGPVTAGPKFMNPYKPQELLDGLKKAQSGDLQGAISDFTIAIKKNPRNFNAYFYRAKAETESGDSKSALDDINNAIKNNNREPVYYYYRGKLYSDAGQSGSALDDFNQALKLKGNFTEALNYRGVEKAKQGKHAEAIKDYDSAILTNSGYQISYYNKGTSQAALSDYKSAIESFTKSISIDKKHELSYMNRGNCYVELENYKAAVADYSAVIQLNPDYSEAYYNRGAAYLLSGDKAMCADWKKAVSLGNSKAKEMLEKYCK